MTSARPAAGHVERRRRARRRSRPGLFVFAGWMLLAGVVAVDRVLDAPSAREEPSLPPVLVVPEPEHAPVTVVAVAPAPAPRERPVPKPFQAIHHFASPLIMPRLSLPRALVPHFTNLSSLLSRARPGEPVAVTLSAYCLQGATRRGGPARPGIIAADPSIFPLARHVELFAGGRFLGRFLVDDTGKRIRGTRIDIWTPDCDDARRFGTRTGVATLVAIGER